MFQYTGEYKKHTSSDRDKRSYYTFTPTPLCDGLPLSVDNELFSLLTTAHKLLGVLEGVFMLSPDRSITKELLCLREGYYSLLIDDENTDAFRDVLKVRAAKRKDLQHINNIVAAQKYSHGKPISNSALSKICSLILYGTESTQTAEIRSKQIYFRRVLTNLKMYTPTAPEDVLPALSDLTKFIRIDNHTDILIKVALAHYQFDMIHPFEKCNGAVGRVLIPMILLNAQYKAASYLCISEFLYRNKEEYFDKLSATQQGNGYSYWIKFFVQAVCHAADQAINQITQFAEIVAEDAIQLSILVKSSKHVIPVYDYFKQYLISEIKPIAEEIGVSYNTTAKAVGLLTGAGLLRLEHEQSRHKVYCHRVLEIFE